MCWNVNNLYGWLMSQNVLVANFKWVERSLYLVKILWKTTMTIVMKDIFLKLIFNILKNYTTVNNDCPFCLKEGKLKELESL